MIENTRDKLSKALKRVGEDDLAIKGGHFDDYLLVYYLGQLVERGEIELLIQEDRKAYFNKLLHVDSEV